MAIETRGAYTAKETAFILRRLLGPAREWWNFLNDVRQDRVPDNVPKLAPVGYVTLKSNRQPIYRPSDISKFAKAWRLRFPKTASSSKPEPIYYINDTTDRTHWRYRNLTVVN